MTEEVTYANLKFENIYDLDNIRKPEDTKGKVFQIPKDYRTQLRDLNMTKNELHANFSNMLQAIGNQLCLEGGKNLKNNGQNCVLCPANWKWEGGDTCYYHSEDQKSWEQSHLFCSSQNSTILLVKDAAKLVWTGFSLLFSMGEVHTPYQLLNSHTIFLNGTVSRSFSTVIRLSWAVLRCSRTGHRHTRRCPLRGWRLETAHLATACHGWLFTGMTSESRFMAVLSWAVTSLI
ncbi:uncharacterized protein LOC104124175 isoform X3 [Egretta garzetta]|uniref:uncharacterized protein LOC104124175 isoform X3 n=1 Tax=Egretta garzetta TaxID=188379 RepID=UPI00163B9A0B|nr:uncharacterized protein LOC104124175 isoform X3 [Egretta garzetta]